ncbi:KIP1-like protein [Musa troglodytarum]|uniref:KIP1-like protein n=1 Tax=Musa troglodytarum TaxID=320322 RepID=A0A9E7F7L4_9LILI|nr:KIP1-like protein [Musa troglodytarum]
MEEACNRHEGPQQSGLCGYASQRDGDDDCDDSELSRLVSVVHMPALAASGSCSADIEQRVQSLAVNLPDDPESDSFAERAENYYQKRPQLIALLHDLHHCYLYLADRYAQSLLHRHHRRTSSVPSDLDADEDTDLPDSTCSDAESSLSFQPYPLSPFRSSKVRPPPSPPPIWT